MKQHIAEWLWRAVIICALGWIGWELHQIREEMLLPADEQISAEAAPDDLQGSVDALGEHVVRLNEKVDAMMMAMMQWKR
jgi:hypothetical protein